MLVRRGVTADDQVVLSPKSEWKTGDSATAAPAATPTPVAGSPK
jgi:hypothetical protein